MERRHIREHSAPTSDHTYCVFGRNRTEVPPSAFLTKGCFQKLATY
jgi:hypothetical protein